MLRVTCEILPFGWEEYKRTLATMEIGLQSVEDGIGTYGSHLQGDEYWNPAHEFVTIKHDRAKGAGALIRKCFEAHHNG